MTSEENIRAKIEFFFKRICELQQEPCDVAIEHEADHQGEERTGDGKDQ